jgi:hypothetical protein
MLTASLNNKYSQTPTSPLSLSAHESLSTEIPNYTIFRFTTTLDIPSQIGVNSGAVSGVDST